MYVGLSQSFSISLKDPISIQYTKVPINKLSICVIRIPKTKKQPLLRIASC
jgi:hypothetical protein